VLYSDELCVTSGADNDSLPLRAAQDMQTLQRRMEFLRGEVLAAVSSGRWEPTVADAATGIHNEL
jgi:hypothetical protein